MHDTMEMEHQTLAIEDLPTIYTAFRLRWEGRNERVLRATQAYQGDWTIFGPDEEQLKSRSPNMVQVGVDDTAEAASLMPTIRVEPNGPGQGDKKTAAKMEAAGANYFGVSRMDLLTIRTVMDLALAGASVWTVLPNPDLKMPHITRRDVSTFYPEPGWMPWDSVRRCIFARELFATQLPPEHQRKLEDFELARASKDYDVQVPMVNLKVTVVEYFSECEIVTAVLYRPSTTQGYGVLHANADWQPVELERLEWKPGVCPVVVGQRLSADDEPRGQFDQVIDMMEAHIRLMAMVLDYSDQAVYSDLWVKDPIGEIPYGGGGIIQLGPQGAIGRVPPAVPGFAVGQDLSMLSDNIHMAGRWPKTRPGDVDQSIASAKFVEATAGMMNTAIRTYHLILKHMMEQALRLCFSVDSKYFGRGSRRIVGVLRNQEFAEDFEPSIIDLECPVRVEYGLGLGRDPAQSAVLMLQYQQGKFISKRFVQENIEGVTDVAREERRLNEETLSDMVLARLLEGVQQKTITDEQLLNILKATADGKTLAEVFEKYVVEAQTANADMGILGALGQGLQPPGAPGQPPLPGPGGPPGAEPGVPPPPDAQAMLGSVGRLSTPAGGPGSFAGTEIKR